MVWHDVGAVSDIPAERGWPVTVEGQPVVVFRCGERLFALANRCLHIGSPLDEGFVEDGCVTCPWHGWRYRLATGDHLTIFGDRSGLATYRVRTVGDRVLVAMD